MIDDLTPARSLGLVLLAVIMWTALIVNSFYSDDSPIQFRGNCPEHVSFSHCSLHLEWVR